MVFIGKNLDAQELEKGFKACLLWNLITVNKTMDSYNDAFSDFAVVITRYIIIRANFFSSYYWASFA